MPHTSIGADTENHIIVTHEVTNVGSDRADAGLLAAQDLLAVANTAEAAKAALHVDELEAVADRGYFTRSHYPNR
jgi:hypothetical protein